ncbi:MAG: site-specific DNA-methyltransferase [Phycisphaerales bacterium]
MSLGDPPHIEHGDCVDVLPRLPGGCADLVYMDPPFMTGRTQRAAAGAYDDVWDDVDDWLSFMGARLEASLACLHESGSIMVHVDWRTSHHVRLWLERRMGPDAFVNHLIWRYGLGGSSPRRFARKHDDILFYARGPQYHFEPPMVPATSVRMAGKLKKATDVLDVPNINNMAAERCGWPTQKPLALLEMLVGAACPPGGLVIDPFCGSGTTIVAAATLGRRAIGIDRDAGAVELASARVAGTELRASVEAGSSGSTASAGSAGSADGAERAGAADSSRD